MTMAKKKKKNSMEIFELSIPERSIPKWNMAAARYAHLCRLKQITPDLQGFLASMLENFWAVRGMYEEAAQVRKVLGDAAYIDR
jgi:hypothetical protein